jgi:hypothetical protein
VQVLVGKAETLAAEKFFGIEVHFLGVGKPFDEEIGKNFGYIFAMVGVGGLKTLNYVEIAIL